MNDNEMLDLYSDYLISSFGLATGTGLSNLLNGQISHDRVQRFLAGKRKTSADLWTLVKAYVRQVEADDGILIVDDSISEKPHTDENEIVCWHYDHAKNRQVKGINFLSCLYHRDGVSLPVGFEIVDKTENYIDKKDGKEKRRSAVGKNERYRRLLRQAQRNQLVFRYVVNDVWFAAAKNMKFVKHELQRDFIMPIKKNRKLALSAADKKQGRYKKLETLALEAETAVEIYLESLDFPLQLIQQVFTNKDGSVGTLYLVSSDLSLSYSAITTIYSKRWNVETYHKSLKQNAALQKSPTRRVTTQTNHLFASLCAYIKLEMLKLKRKTNHFALKSQLHLRAMTAAFHTLGTLQPIQFSA